DIHGQGTFPSLPRCFHRGAQGIILVYDVTSRQTFSSLEALLNDVETYSTLANVAKVIIGNKIDEESQVVIQEEALMFARKHSTLFFEASAKTGEGVQCAFEELVRKIIQTPSL
ncbi:unnamed protein product, partial [Darwinula stevensoni]